MNITNVTILSLNKNEDNNNFYLNWPILILILFSFIGIIGNLMVCIAIGIYRKLQNVTNYYLVSLAVADLLVSLIVIPLAILQSLLNTWILGTPMCILWIFFDVILCTTSILLLCVISCERYFGISNPLNNRQKSKIKTKLVISFVWLLSIILSSPVIILGLMDKSNVFIRGQCTLNNNHFIIYGSILSFIIPLFILIAMYVLTVNKLKMATEQFTKDKNGNLHKTNENGQSSVGGLERHKKSKASVVKVKNQNSETGLLSINERSLETKRKLTRAVGKQILITRAVTLFTRTHQSNVVQSEKKAIKVLGIVFVMFVIAWVPFAIVNMLNALKAFRINPTLLSCLVWLGYLSSAFNPIIYNAFNKHFRFAFNCILTCKLNELQLKNDKQQCSRMSINRSKLSLNNSKAKYNRTEFLVHEILTSV